ncbi:c-type cytochrome [Ramlibacter algicola]|uniref:Cytochrome c n=1 Tax=Ramlibacter algicola TaxID=2795217 RepID=A0A934UTG2_9BURK|nr:cytochrome c [Ramlibacter algicola]MBK0394916.1 cytochrome c [Ramlibacter algicola]
MFEKAIASALLVTSISTVAQPGPAPAWKSVGRTAAATEVTSKAITVFPDGAGLPTGRGTVERGRDIFAARCAACHGWKAEGNDYYPALVGGQGTLKSREPILTVGSYWPHATTLWDYIRRAMPYDEPGSLSTDDSYAVTSYILHLNGLLEADGVLDHKVLSAVRMPNRDGFVPDGRRGSARNGLIPHDAATAGR